MQGLRGWRRTRPVRWMLHLVPFPCTRDSDARDSYCHARLYLLLPGRVCSWVHRLTAFEEVVIAADAWRSFAATIGSSEASFRNSARGCSIFFAASAPFLVSASREGNRRARPTDWYRTPNHRSIGVHPWPASYLRLYRLWFFINYGLLFVLFKCLI
jgi:hypothetical protein